MGETKKANGMSMRFIDSYSADVAEREMLTAKPVSFLILGKRKCGKTSLARYLSHDWGAKLITEVDLIENELEYIGAANQVPAPPSPVNIAVVGAPKSGKSTVARRFAAELGLVTLSPVDIVDLLLAKYPKSLIAERVHAELVSGAVISKALLYQGLDLILMDERAATRGYVLDGLPVTKTEFDILQRRSIVPFRVVELDITLDEALVRTGRIRLEKEKLRFQLEMARLQPKSEDDEEEEEDEEDEGDESGDQVKHKTTNWLIPIEDDFNVDDNDELLTA